ncbi:MAG: HD domain-containing protein [Acholeplasmatales bacterium]|nr:HD domain-containing protein [Acholeplasmatales bacterium]
MEYIAVVESFNQGEGFSNVTIKLENGESINLKATLEQMENLNVGSLYLFNASTRVYHEKEQLVLDDAKDVFSIYDTTRLLSILPKFYQAAPFDAHNAIAYIEDTLNKIKNDKIRTITQYLYYNNKDNFIIYPAATKFHHAYVSGLLYHTYRMLLNASGICKIYDYLDTDLVYAGIILHDIAKVYEFSSAIKAQYTTEGLLLGHIVLGTLAIERAAFVNCISGEEVMILEHIVLSHHGIPEFGSPKRPMLPEAIVVNMVDDMDSKLTVVGENLDTYAEGEFSQGISVLNKTRLYKPIKK